MSKHEDIVIKILNSMIGIGGAPTNEEFYTELNRRLRDELGISDTPTLSTVPSEWKKYPHEKPDKRDRYRVISKEWVDDKYEFCEVHAIYSRIEDDFYYEGMKIKHPIAFMPIPEYKP